MHAIMHAIMRACNYAYMQLCTHVPFSLTQNSEGHQRQSEDEAKEKLEVRHPWGPNVVVVVGGVLINRFIAIKHGSLITFES